MNFTSLLHRKTDYASERWVQSDAVPGVRFAIRRISLAQRLELTMRVRELIQRNEFLKSGNAAEQLEVSLGDLLTQKLYLEWGLSAIENLHIDGQPATAELLIEKGPESLTAEIVGALRQEIGLSEEERKNS
ncbi:MAG TPA: hypothetical protein VKV79_02520 [Terriglobia bacterium]|nr:hypothetical protein [Terriglobia bacterium]